MTKSAPVIIRVRASDLSAAEVDMLAFIQNPLDAIIQTARDVGNDKGYGDEGISELIDEIIELLDIVDEDIDRLYSIGEGVEFKVMIDGVEQDPILSERLALRMEIQMLENRIAQAKKRLIELS